LIDEYARDRGHKEPRIRIGFVDLPESWARELVMYEMPCVACGRPNHPLRKRVGDDWSRLFYAPSCELSKRYSCSRTRAAALEYQRFAGLDDKRPSQQLSLL
jgi:hypothetical protein